MSSPRIVNADRAEAFRLHLGKVLNSSEFANSRQAREFLQYVAGAALEGRSHLDQVEIAERVLNRGSDFNPIDDASVRKLATTTRQKLERYYASEGASDPVVLVLPLRSYVPVFRLRSAGEAQHNRESSLVLPVDVEPPSSPSEDSHNAPSISIGWRTVRTLTERLLKRYLVRGNARAFIIETQRGDILHGTNDAPGQCIRVGPKLAPVDEVTVCMEFSPEAASQQGGLMVFEDADRYVKLGRQFTSRNQWEFGLETGGRYQKPPGTFTYDPTGQDGRPVWLSIRRDHNVYRGFISGDGIHWRKIGNTLEMPDPMPNARAAIYAYNGRTNAASTVAVFRDLRVGPVFHDWPRNDSCASPIEGWTATSNCGDDLGAPRMTETGLEFVFRGRLQKRCDWMLTRPVPPGNWAIQTRMDFQFLSSTIAGLIVSGREAYLRLIRWDINNGSITVEQSGGDQVSLPDFPGNPPITMRMECRSGVVRSSFSRDGAHFIEVPNPVRLEYLGNEPRFGIHTGVSSWVGPEPPSPARFHYLQQEVLSLFPYR